LTLVHTSLKSPPTRLSPLLLTDIRSPLKPFLILIFFQNILMGRPRRNSNKSESGSTAGNVYNASLAAAQQQKVLDSTNSLVSTSTATSIPTNSYSSSTAATNLTPQLDAILSVAASEIESENRTTVSNPSINTAAPNLTVAPQSNPTGIHRRSLSIAELVSIISTRNTSGANIQVNATSTNSATATTAPGHSATSATVTALNALNLPEALRSTLEKADSPILNALLPLIRQKLAAKTSLNRRNSAVDPGQDAGSTTSLDSQSSRRSSTSSRSEDHRLSHKLAERKRRKEMKDVFDNLKDALPPDVPKSSKWEILNEASSSIDDLLTKEQALLNQRNQLLKRINDTSK
jgi:hypothetical protein